MEARPRQRPARRSFHTSDPTVPIKLVARQKSPVPHPARHFLQIEKVPKQPFRFETAKYPGRRPGPAVRKHRLDGSLAQTGAPLLEPVIIKYKDDALAGILYGRPLVLFKSGDRKGAEQALKAAVSQSPRIAAELQKPSHRRPEAEMAGCITMGGRAEAFEYRAGFGRFWTADALDWLREIADKSPASNQKP